MLVIENLEVKVKNKKIIKAVTLKIKDGEIHVLMGPNGAGKSSLGKTLLRDPNYRVIQGKIEFKGQNLLALNTTQVAQLGFYLVGQNPMEIEGVTTAELLRTVLNDQNKRLDIIAFSQELESICRKLELPPRYVHRDINVAMSGGEKKKIELLQLMMLKPKFIILDEIDSGLDIDAIKIAAQTIADYWVLAHPSILIITHHHHFLKYLKPDFVHIMLDGQIVQSGDFKLADQIEKEGFNSLKGTTKGTGINPNE